MSHPDQWYVGVNGEVRGPYSLLELRERIGKKRLATGTLAWAPGMRDWTLLDDVPGLKATAPPPLPASRTGPPVMPTVEPYSEPNRRSFSFFEKPTTEQDALRAVKDGSSAGFLLAGAYLLSAFLTTSSGSSVATGETLSSSDQGETVFIMVVLAGFAIGLAVWIRHKASLLGLNILCVWFSVEVLAKLAAFATYPNAKLPAVWFAIYLGILGTIVTAMRGAAFLRRMRKARERKQQ